MNRVRRLFERPSRVFLFLIAFSCLTPGCGVKPAAPEAARKALKTVLDGWKGGQTQADLKKKSSIHTNEAYVDQRLQTSRLRNRPRGRDGWLQPQVYCEALLGGH